MELNLSEPGQSRYLRVYEYYKELIVSGQMKPGAKLPSIRKCSLQLQLSRTTVETAYMLLAADGYIISRPQSGFYVTDAVLAAANREEIEHGVPHQEERPEIRYDFASSNVDRESFQFDLWRRYVKSALRQDERLLSYGEPQGEREFREALCAYLGRHRNVICTPDSIVVGAGVQSLLHILCPMLRERDSAWFFNPSFRQGRQIFEDYGFWTGDIREYWEIMIGGLSPQKGFVRNRKARCMCKRDENRVIRTDVRGDETYREKCLLSDPIADDSLGRGHAGGRPDEAFKGCGARGYADY